MTHGTGRPCSGTELQRRLRGGETLREIALDLGVSHSTVWRHKRSLGLGAVNSERVPEHDTPEQTSLCLSCTRPECPGTCRVIRAAARPS